MAYLVNFCLTNYDLEPGCELIDEEAIFLSIDMDKINRWAKTMIKAEMRKYPNKWITAFNSVKWKKDDETGETVSYIKELKNDHYFSIICSEIPLIA